MQDLRWVAVSAGIAVLLGRTFPQSHKIFGAISCLVLFVSIPLLIFSILIGSGMALLDLLSWKSLLDWVRSVSSYSFGTVLVCLGMAALIILSRSRDEESS